VNRDVQVVAFSTRWDFAFWTKMSGEGTALTDLDGLDVQEVFNYIQ
jgi:hypothetical protein